MDEAPRRFFQQLLVSTTFPAILGCLSRYIPMRLGLGEMKGLGFEPKSSDIK